MLLSRGYTVLVKRCDELDCLHSSEINSFKVLYNERFLCCFSFFYYGLQLPQMYSSHFVHLPQLPNYHWFLLYNIYQKPKNSVVWEGRPNFSFLFKSCEILEVRGDLSINVENKKSLRVDRQAYKNYALALVLCAFNNSKSI